MGAILEAADAKLKRTVAVKLMLFDAGFNREMQQRFIREAEVLACLEHPNIVPIHDIVWERGAPLFYTMKRVNGRTLQAILNDLRKEDAAALRDFTLDRLLLIFRKVCDAMAFAHSKGIIHRDLKPENVMIGEFGEVLVMDWGLAKETRKSEVGSRNENNAPAASRSDFRVPTSDFRTLQGSVMGTPQYMSPEQARGEIDGLDERSDIFSLGGILYAVLTLRPPIEGATLEDVLDKVINAQITSPSDYQAGTISKRQATKKGDVLEARLIKPLPHAPAGRVPAALSSVVMKALRLDKAQRYQAVGELSADIEKFQAGFATMAEQAGAWRQFALLMARHQREVTVATAALLALIGFGVWFVVNLRASERVAKKNEQLARKNEELARTNERRAVAQEEETRRALAQSQIAVAEGALRSGDRNTMEQALDSVPEDLRNQVWGYLSAKRDASLGALPNVHDVSMVAAVPGQPDLFAVAHRRSEVRLVNVRTGASVWTVKLDLPDWIRLGVAPDGSLLAVTANGANEIHLLRASDGRTVRTLPTPTPAIHRVVFSPDASLLACGEQRAADASLLTLIDASDGAVRWQIKRLQAAMDFSPDGTRLLVSSNGAQRFFRIYDVATGKELHSHVANAFTQTMSLDGKFIAVGLQNGEVVVFDVATGNEVQRGRLHDGLVHAMSWTAGGHLLTVGGEGGMGRSAKGRRLMRLWDGKTFAPRGTFLGLSQKGSQSSWAFQPESGWLITEESTPQRWNIPVDLEVARIASVAEQGWSIAFASDTLLVSRRAWDLGLSDVSQPRFPQKLPPVSRSGDAICAVHWRAGLLAIGNGLNAAPYGIKLHATDAAMTLKREIPLAERITGLDFDTPGERLLAIGLEKDSLVVDVQSGKQLLTIPAGVQHGFFAGTAGHIVAIMSKKDEAGETRDSLMIFDGKTGRELRNEPQPFSLNALAVSPDRRLIAVAGEEQVVRVLDADTLAERWRFRAHDDDIRALSFHPSQPILASASNDGTLKLWDYETSNLRQTFYGLDGPPVAIAFSPNGRLLALEAQEKITRLFDLATTAAPVVAKKRANPVIKPDTEGWLDLLAAANAEDIATEGQGWRLQDGALHSPDAPYATAPLPLDKLPDHYTVRITARRTEATREFGIFFPVAERNIGFNFDMWQPKCGSVLTFGSGLNMQRPDVVWGSKFHDLANHTIELTVRVTRPQAHIAVQFDGKPHYQWTGPLSEVTRSSYWNNAASGVISVGSHGPHWIVSEVKVKRIE